VALLARDVAAVVGRRAGQNVGRLVDGALAQEGGGVGGAVDRGLVKKNDRARASPAGQLRAKQLREVRGRGGGEVVEERGMHRLEGMRPRAVNRADLGRDAADVMVN